MLRKKLILLFVSVLLLVTSMGYPVSAEESTLGAGSWTGKQYKASEAYNTTKQGNQFWYYQDWNGSTYQNMTYNSSIDSWQGREEWSRIGFRGADKMHPGRSNIDSVHTFEAPVNGTIAVTSLIKKYDRNGGDGVNVKIVHNDSQVWPATGWQHIAYNEENGVAANIQLDVEKGDYIRFILNQNIDISNDNTIWDPVITYLSSEAPDIPVITGVEEGSVYRTAKALEWIDAAGTTSTSDLTRNNGSSVPYAKGTLIEENGQYVLKVTTTRTSNGLTASSQVAFSLNLSIGAGDWVGRSFKASEAYSMIKQGVGNWYYMDWDGTEYHYMGYQSIDFNAWQGRSPYTLIGWNGAETVHPGDGSDMVRMFKVPVEGEVLVTGSVRKRDKNGGDGIRAKIMLNEVQIWPASGWQSIAFNDGDGYAIHLPVQVSRDDKLLFIVNKNGTITNDSTYWDPSVTYVSSEAPEQPVIEGVEDYGVYTVAMPYWSDPAGTTSAAQLSKDGGAPEPYVQGTSITAQGNYVLRVTRGRTSDDRTYLASSQIDFSIGMDSKKRYVASEGFSTAGQGIENWYYFEKNGNGYAEMTYSQQEQAWLSTDGEAQITADTMLPGISNDSVRGFKAPVEGNMVISGIVNNPNAESLINAKAKMVLNDVQIWPSTGWADLAYNNGVGYSINQPVYVFPGDEIRFIVSSGGGTIEKSLEWNPIVSYSADPLKQMLHFRQPSHYIGDVHPFYENGIYYLFYLKPGTFEPLLVTSTDMIHWQTETLTHGNPLPAQIYYALGVFKDGDKYRSYYGNFSSMKGSESTDLLHWNKAPETYDIANNMNLFPSGSRDPYVFWDPDIEAYRMVSTAYRSKPSTGGTILDASIALTTSNGADLTSWGTQIEMIRFPNTNVPLSSAQDPEVAQMFKMGERWYLMSSIAGQSVHHVGKPTYWIGSPNTPIDQENWSSKQAHSLDGEDLAAVQIFQGNGKWYMLGWIPQQSSGNAWGGHLSLPREIYQLSDGKLAVRLESAISMAIRGELLYSSASSLPIVEEAGSWQHNLSTIDYSGTSFGMAKLPGTYDRIDLEMNVALGAGAVRGGLLLDKDTSGPYGYEIALDRVSNMIKIRRDATGSGGWVNFAEMKVEAGDLNGINNVRVIAEGDILEVFVNDKYSLAARISSAFSATGIRLFASGGDASFGNVRIHALKSKGTVAVEQVMLSTAKPRLPVLSDDNGWHDANGQDGDYQITMNMWYGDNGRIYKLYENDQLIDTQVLTDDSPNAQKAVTSIAGKPNGTYRYFAELSNAFGMTKSATYTVEVTNAAPGQHVLSSDNWDGDGNFTITMNLWWGTNGNLYRFYENEVLIYSQELTPHSPAPQSAVVSMSDKALGSYQYRGELINGTGTTSSDTIIVDVTK
jgi:hypothetical protein